jgi:hypothetical protein
MNMLYPLRADTHLLVCHAYANSFETTMPGNSPKALSSHVATAFRYRATGYLLLQLKPGTLPKCPEIGRTPSSDTG